MDKELAGVFERSGPTAARSMLLARRGRAALCFMLGDRGRPFMRDWVDLFIGEFEHSPWERHAVEW